MLQDKFLICGLDSNIKNPSHFEYGKERVISFSFDLATIARPLVAGETILGVRLPKNCLLLGAKVVMPNMGATGIARLGITNDEGEDYGLVPVADAGGQAVNERDGADSSLIGTVLGLEDNNLILEITEDTANAVGVIQAFVTVVVE